MNVEIADGAPVRAGRREGGVSSTVWTATLTGRVPAKKNSRRWVTTPKGQRVSIPSAAHEAWHTAAGYQLKPYRPAEKISGPFAATFVITRPNRQHWTDPDNQLTSLLDLLEDMQVIAKDRDAVNLHTIVIDGAEWRVDITIRPAD